MTSVPAAAGFRRAPFEAAPTITALSLGAGVQSSTCLLLACRREIAPFDVAMFADTGWEPQAVYRHLDRLERLAARRPCDHAGLWPVDCPATTAGETPGEVA